MKKSILFLCLILSGFQLSAQKQAITEGNERLSRFENQLRLIDQSPYKDLNWQFLGPLNISGRCTDIEVVQPKGEHYEIWVASASGGIWKSTDSGATWESTFDQQVTTDIGDLAIDPKNSKVVWAGTGEANIFRSSMAGCGIYKTTDGGKSWKNMGLENTNTIARVVIHPEKTDVVYVAASGHEWTPNPERGVYKTSDGGKTWNNILFVNDLTGAIDLVMDPRDPNTLYACTWQRIRKKWNDPRTLPGYNGSGVWKTTDGGATWKQINQGLPAPEHLGRIGIDIARSNPDILYLLVDNYEIAREAKPGDLDSYGRQKAGVIKGATVYKTTNQGATWSQVSGQSAQMKKFMEGHSGTYGWVFGQIRVDPVNENKVYTLGLFLNTSTDGGKTYEAERSIHMDHHALWVDPENPDYMLSGNDGGIYVSYDCGKSWKHFVEIPVIQFYNVGFSLENPFHIYGSIQDHFSFRGKVDLSRGRDKIPAVEWESAPGGEGCNHVVDPRNPNILYSAGFYGSLTRSEYRDGKWTSAGILPKPGPGEPPLRGQWVAPFILSPHNPDVVYHGMQYLFRSPDQGKSWTRISPDLTHNNPANMGDISYQTLFALSESPLTEGLIYTGSDDGKVHVTRDGGTTWKDISKGLAADRWISRIVASKYNPSTVYLTQNGKRDDDFQVYVWKSDDYGTTWTDISKNIPLGPVNVIREDPTDPDILYTGTDIGVYVSKDQGVTWQVAGNLPSTYVQDLAIHPLTNLMIIATHGRGMWALDLNPINQ